MTIMCAFSLSQGGECSFKPAPGIMSLSVPPLITSRDYSYSVLEKDRRGRYHSKDSMVERERPRSRGGKENSNSFPWTRSSLKAERPRRPLQLRNANTPSSDLPIKPASKLASNVPSPREVPLREKLIPAQKHEQRFGLRPARGFQRILESIRRRKSSEGSVRPAVRISEPGETECQSRSDSASSDSSTVSYLPRDALLDLPGPLTTIQECSEPGTSTPSTHSIADEVNSNRSALEPSQHRGMLHSKACSNLLGLVAEAADESCVASSEKSSPQVSECSGLLMTLALNADAASATELEGRSAVCCMSAELPLLIHTTSVELTMVVILASRLWV